ncbi:MAG: 3-dehydroquinate synthase [Bacteroidetes bacterium]|nr:3-dehydroquinate synthase [Bacteroidota bacterium]
MKKIDVTIPQKSYPFFIGENILPKLPGQIKKLGLNKNLFLIIDRNVQKFYGKTLDELFSDFEGKVKKQVITASEKNKTHETLTLLYNSLLKNGFGRDTVIVAIGGGIVGDIAGFVASTFSRGVQYVQVPTTLLAAVDSSVGGKTGVNFGATKNIVGAFYQPDFVLFDTDFLKTLGEKELLCGIGEITKYAFLAGQSYFNYASKNIDRIFDTEKNVVSRIVVDSISYKASVVSKDEKESGIRKVLNLGHTFAHAVEVEQSHKIKHGEAVIVGIVCSLFLSNKLMIISDVELKKQLGFFNRFLGRIKISKPNLDALYKIMLRDKKNRENIIKFVLIKTSGEILLDVVAEKKDVYFALKNGLQLFS